MSAEARVVHRLPGRLRLRFPRHKDDPAFLANVATALAACPGVADVRPNPRIGSLLVIHTTSEESLFRFAGEQGLFSVGSGAEAAPDIQAQVADGVAGLRRTLQAVSGRDVDVNALVVAGLAALAVQQALAGNIVAPALSLLWYAYSAAGVVPGGRRGEAGDSEERPGRQ